MFLVVNAPSVIPLEAYFAALEQGEDKESSRVSSFVKCNVYLLWFCHESLKDWWLIFVD